MSIKCPHCGEEIKITGYESGLQGVSIKSIMATEQAQSPFTEYYVEKMGGLTKHIFGRPDNPEELKQWKKSWDEIKGTMSGMDYSWKYDPEKGLVIHSTGYSMFFQDPFPDIWFFFWLSDDNYFRQKFFEDCRLVVEDDGTFRTEVLNKEGEFVDGGGAHGSTSKEVVEKYKKRLEGAVPDEPRKDTFFL